MHSNVGSAMEVMWVARHDVIIKRDKEALTQGMGFQVADS